MLTHCTQDPIEFQGQSGRDVVADFGGGQITSDAGGLLLREVAARTNLIGDMASCFTDRRDPSYTTHSLKGLLAQRVLGIACGYEDLIDHDRLRADPMWSLLAGKASPATQPVAGKSTLNRLETSVGRGKPGRYHKIFLDEEAFEGMFADWYVAAHQAEAPSEVILDLDASDIPLHGDQEQGFFHGYYDHYCYLPLFIFAGEHLLWAELRPADQHAATGATEAVARITDKLRAAWPGVRIILRADSGFAGDELMGWCEAHGVEYVFGLAGNSRLKQAVAAHQQSAGRLAAQTGRPERVYHEFAYQTRRSWSRSRRVIGKATVSEDAPNPRFVVTSLHGGRWAAAECYEQLYCARGEAENRIKEHQLGLFGARTSCAAMGANQLRLWLAGVAYWLITELRRVGLAGTRWARAQAQTVRAELGKIGALLRVSVRRVYLALSSGYPWKDTFRQVAGNIRRGWEPSRC